MKTYKIFLASSSELTYDREQFEIFINRKNKDWVTKGVHLDLVIWENFLDCVSKTRLQDEYNKAISESDLFILMYSTGVGKYSNEEFQTAYDFFLASGKPKIYTYWKKPHHAKKNENQILSNESLLLFQEKLLNLGHYQTVCENTQDFLLHFSQQLEKLADIGFFQFNTETLEKSIPHDLTLPPFKPEVFIGREHDIITLKELFFQNNSQLILLNGEGGMGKTSIASEYYHAFKNEYKHCAWILSSSDIADSLIHNLSKSLCIEFTPKMTPEERLELTFSALLSLPKPCLLIIDNADNPNKLEEVYLMLRRLTNFHILITTRLNKFHNATIHPITALSHENSLDLFREYYPYQDAFDDALFHKISEAVGGNTLVIELISKNLALLNQNENNYTLMNLLQDIQTKGLLSTKQSDSEELETTYHAETKINYAKPFDLISTMYDLGNLTNNEVAVLSNLAVLPPEKIESKALFTLLNPEFKPDNTLKSLNIKGWIEFSPPTRSYKCNPLIQQIVISKNEHLYDDSIYMITQLNHLLKYQNDGHLLHLMIDQASVFVTYGENLLLILQKSLKTKEDANLCDRISNYFLTVGNLNKALLYCEKSYHLLHQILTEIPSDESLFNFINIITNLGDICRFFGEYEKALQYYTQSNGLLIEFNRDHPSELTSMYLLTTSYQRTGNIYLKIGNQSLAYHFLALSKELIELLLKADSSKMSYKNNLAIVNAELGDISLKQGDLQLALDFLTQANQLFEELSNDPLGLNFKYNHVISLMEKSNILRKIGRFDEALQDMEKSISICKELCDEFPQNFSFKKNLAISYGFLGNDFLAKQKTEEALKSYTLYNQLCIELNKECPEDLQVKYNMAISFERLGDTYNLFNNEEKTIEFYEISNKLQIEINHSNQENVLYMNELALSFEKLGNAYILYQQNKEKALSCLQSAEKLFVELVDKSPEFDEYKLSLERIRNGLEDIQTR